VPNEKVQRLGSEGESMVGRARGKLRAARFATWRELREAVLACCRAEVGRVTPEFPLAEFEEKARRRRQSWERGDPALQIWRELRGIVAKAEDYLRANPDAVGEFGYATVLNAFLSAPCIGADGKLLPVRERLATWGRPQKQEFAWLDESARTRIVQTYSLAGVLWWGDRKPTARDLAIATLLSGCVPEGVKKRQDAATTPAERPTVGDVMAAEVGAVSEVLRRRRRPLK
jgi:hypothetical protein